MYIYILFIFVVYLNLIYVLYIPNQNRIYLSWADNLCSAISTRPNPEFIIARKYVETPFTTSYVDYNSSYCNVDARGSFEFMYRPVFGDHIHLGYSMYINKRIDYERS